VYTFACAKLSTGGSERERISQSFRSSCGGGGLTINSVKERRSDGALRSQHLLVYDLDLLVEDLAAEAVNRHAEGRMHPVVLFVRACK